MTKRIASRSQNIRTQFTGTPMTELTVWCHRCWDQQHTLQHTYRDAVRVMKERGWTQTGKHCINWVCPRCSGTRPY